MILSVPSWLAPGTWLENLGVAAGLPWVEGVELLMFVWDGTARADFAREARHLAEEAARFRFSLHLPATLEGEVGELIGSTEAFVGTYVVHPPRVEEGADGLRAWAGLLDSWRGDFGDRFLLEYTGREEFSRALAALPDLPLCADTGRLLLDGREPLDWIRERGGAVREIHLHGLSEGRDHAALDPSAPWLGRLAPLLADFPGIVELELFSLEGVLRSKAALEALSGPRGDKVDMA